MSEEKPYEPTPSRLEKAKREGDVAKSQELGNVAAFAAGLVVASGVVLPIGSAARAILASGAGGQTNVAAAVQLATLMMLPAAAAACAAAAVNAAQGGGLRFVAITANLQRLAPAENFKRMFSKESLVTAVRATAAFASAAIAIVPAFAGIYAATVHASDLDTIVAAAWSGALRTADVACVVGAVFAGVDYGVQVVRRRKRLRMSFEELKRDQKEHDGDPLARSRRRTLHRQLSRGSLRKVREAAFVLTNPTHLAIALEYRPPSVPVPRVLVRAADETAARVRELAAEFGVPVVENVPLARSLYATARPGEFIPRETYVAVAEIVASLAKAGAFTL